MRPTATVADAAVTPHRRFGLLSDLMIHLSSAVMSARTRAAPWRTVPPALVVVPARGMTDTGEEKKWRRRAVSPRCCEYPTEKPRFGGVNYWRVRLRVKVPGPPGHRNPPTGSAFIIRVRVLVAVLASSNKGRGAARPRSQGLGKAGRRPFHDHSSRQARARCPAERAALAAPRAASRTGCPPMTNRRRPILIRVTRNRAPERTWSRYVRISSRSGNRLLDTPGHP